MVARACAYAHAYMYACQSLSLYVYVWACMSWLVEGARCAELPVELPECRSRVGGWRSLTTESTYIFVFVLTPCIYVYLCTYMYPSGGPTDACDHRPKGYVAGMHGVADERSEEVR